MNSTTIDVPWLSEVISASSQQDVEDALSSAHADETAVYPIGGGTSLDFGLPAKREGVGISLADMNSVVDFPARDLTITVEAGITMRALTDALDKENLCLPIDVPNADSATLGGVIATNFNGPRRYGQGTVRDYVIGVNAVDGRGKPFKGGGRVVKNVAGYDFCKLLTGSLGTLGVITQVTLRLKPIPQRTALIAARVKNTTEAEQRLASMIDSTTTPVAIELVGGPVWADDPALSQLITSSDETFALVVGIEGSDAEVKWMLDTLGREWQSQGVEEVHAVLDDDAASLWQRLAEFPQAGEAALSLKASLLPSHVANFIAATRKIDPNANIQAHAGSGVVIVRFSEFPAEGLSRTLVQQLAPTAARGNGNVIVLSNPGGAEMTHQSVWDASDAPLQLMGEVKRQFDPKNILNPDRFVYV